MKKVKTLLALILVICMLPVCNVSAAEGTISVEFNDSQNRHGGGVVTITSAADGKVWLYWGTDGEKIADHSYFGFCDITEGSGSFEIQRFTYIPEGATEILAFSDSDDSLIASYTLPDYKIKSMGEKSYSFGATSDSHIGHSTYPTSEDDFVIAYNKFGEYGVSAIFNDGDLSSYNLIHDWSLYSEKVNEFNQTYPYIPCFVITGNHDASHNDFMLDEWNKYTRDSLVNYKGNTVAQFYDGNVLDFTYTIENDVFICLNATDWKDTSHAIDYYSYDQIEWLERRLEENKDKRVFLFVHYGTYESNAFYNAEGGYTAGGGFGKTTDYMNERFNQMYKKYPNVIAFFGHTHRSFTMQFAQYVQATAHYDTYDANINNIEGGSVFVHVPCLNAPSYYTYSEKTGTASSDQNDDACEAYMVDVYDDCIVLRGYDFIKDEFISYANYIVDVGCKFNDVEIKEGYLLDNTDKSITIKGCAGTNYANMDVVMMLTAEGVASDSITFSDILYFDQQKADANGGYSFTFKLPKTITDERFKAFINAGGVNITGTVSEAIVETEWIDADVNISRANDGKIKALYTVKNYGDSDISYNTLLAIYNEEGRLIDVKMIERTVAAGMDNERIEIELSEDAHSISAYVMSADGNIRPVCTNTYVDVAR